MRAKCVLLLFGALLSLALGVAEASEGEAMS